MKYRARVDVRGGSSFTRDFDSPSERDTWAQREGGLDFHDLDITTFIPFHAIDIIQFYPVKESK